MKKERGLSPIIASVLLISLSLALAIIIFLWARSFVGENVQKEGRAIESSCNDVSFEAEVDSGNLYIENTGSMPIYGFEIKEKKLFGGEVKNVPAGEGVSVGPGETAEPISLDLEEGIEITVSPILLGETETYKKAYICSDEFGKDIEV